MKNIIWYINEYGNKTFEEEKINELDILIFSQLIYNDFSSVFYNKNQIIFKDLVYELINNNKKGLSIAKDNALDILKNMNNKKRYENIIFQNYLYSKSDIHQFGAITIKINNMLYINFEGTDNTISGWKENFEFSYNYPTKSQELAGKYINDILEESDCSCIIIGHSKGGNLAITGAMNTKPSLRDRIKNIYSFDGPGLLLEQFNSMWYYEIKDKIIDIIPNQSIIGVLLYHDNLTVIKSIENGIMQHSILSWIVDEKQLKRTKRSKLSVEFENTFNRWLVSLSYNDRKRFCDSIFKILKNKNIETFKELKRGNLKTLLSIIQKSINLSQADKNFILKILKSFIENTNLLIINNSKEIIDSKKEQLIEFINKREY